MKQPRYNNAEATTLKQELDTIVTSLEVMDERAIDLALVGLSTDITSALATLRRAAIDLDITIKYGPSKYS